MEVVFALEESGVEEMALVVLATRYLGRLRMVGTCVWQDELLEML